MTLHNNNNNNCFPVHNSFTKAAQPSASSPGIPVLCRIIINTQGLDTNSSELCSDTERQVIKESDTSTSSQFVLSMVSWGRYQYKIYTQMDTTHRWTLHTDGHYTQMDTT